MKILSLDTSTEYMSLGLKIYEDFHSINIKAGQTHSEIVLPEINKFLSDHQLTTKDLDAIAFGKGPGSFTGIRIACGIAYGLGYGASIPVIGVNNLLALADRSGKNKVISVIDARMGEIYFSAYIKEGKTFSEPMFEGVYKPDELPRIKESGWTLIGNAIETYKQEMKDHFGQQIENLIDGPIEVVESISKLATPFIKNKIFELIHAEPVYLRNKVAFTIEERKALNAI
ncbi:MAG TPA: tRNA (adenosine(37)-N6)-threonylcarbamoyltransferase complex dimerization subunit type 1 TsaB [Methylophilaceae bacterium]|jgi:tRNA threonylcarbamoyladenosine biosynthesis protein TsaB|nr:tRNA (adenosine(37)-N6)-threonylcarbamoyltransferase complex dimerization subunit type 1 TsaB [Methylophilaceae bacterium]HAP04836.1 tRNA (adenosine(37)-N6)-threonylcarbamoyltransferase complex dimerization subunit type 1 TsaB [Methylophilaceae bacterium]HBO18027.1 tRNA (adenosine(37)-N6)-threonylcarbamoyltransferase complex dimerization subunit type 1 TsaB [Methylophilaceae bacterium]HCC72217.1 tRNA (adenosine(37)-N6)-threonylcarbamoyltransferase complex dimerization subunit type 1 TsaB [Met